MSTERDAGETGDVGCTKRRTKGVEGRRDEENAVDAATTKREGTGIPSPLLFTRVRGASSTTRAHTRSLDDAFERETLSLSLSLFLSFSSAVSLCTLARVRTHAHVHVIARNVRTYEREGRRRERERDFRVREYIGGRLGVHRCACLAENPATCAWNARANVARRRVLAVANLFAPNPMELRRIF